jgi:hypothetical protein
MKTNLHNLAATALTRVLLLGLAAAWPSLANAQVGITGSALGPTPTELAARASGFDRGLQSKSALGQLQELSGQRIGTSSSRNPTLRTPVPRTPKPARAPTLSTNQQMQVAVTGMVLGMVMNSIFQDDSAQREAEAAAAAAEAARIKAEQDAATAEAILAHQRAVQIARAEEAEANRADWEARERESSAQMAGVFDVASSGDTHTDFFGQGPGPDKDVLAAILGSAVEGEPAAPVEEPVVVAPADLGGQVRALGTYFAPEVRGSVVEVGQGILESTAWAMAENVPGQAYVKAMSDFDSDRREMTEAMGGRATGLLGLSLGDGSIVRALALPGYGDSEFVENYWQRLAREARLTVIEAWKLAYGRVTGQAEVPGVQQLGIFDDGN